MNDAMKNADRFTGFADIYEQVRPQMPLHSVEIITRYFGGKLDLVVDMGCGTGLSTLIWKGCCERVIGIEPNDDMLTVARQKSDANISFIKAFAHETGLHSDCADVVVCSQSFHWMDPVLTLKEVDRILKKNGMFATIDCDWPPVCNWRAEKAYSELFDKVSRVEKQNSNLNNSYFRWDKNGHLQKIKNSGYFRYAREIVFDNAESCDAERFIGLALSQGGLQNILKNSPELIERDLKEFTKTIKDLFGGREFEIFFNYRMRIGVR